MTLDRDEPVRARLDLWSFGYAAIFRAESNGVSMTRTPRAARSATGEHIAIGVHEFGVARHRFGPDSREVPAGQGLVVDVSRPFDYGWRGHGAARSLNVPTEHLALPPDLVWRAGPHLAASPLYPLVSRYIVDDGPGSREVQEQTLVTQIRAYVRLVRLPGILCVGCVPADGAVVGMDCG